MEEQGIGRPSTYAPTVSTILDREYVIKEGKYLHITNLGRVVTQLMKERFSDIADLKFTANMEKKLDGVEEGTVNWKIRALRDFYGDFDENLKKAEKDLEGVYIKVPDEVSEEICPVCGRNLVVKSGRFGRFLACPGYPGMQLSPCRWWWRCRAAAPSAADGCSSAPAPAGSPASSTPITAVSIPTTGQSAARPATS